MVNMPLLAWLKRKTTTSVNLNPNALKTLATVEATLLINKGFTPHHQIITINVIHVGAVCRPPINQTRLHYFKTRPSSIQAFSGLPSNPREKTSSWVSYLTMGPPPLACWSPICSGSAQPSWA